MVANFWLRLGNSYTANNLQAFLEETLGHFPGKRMDLLRLDSGFCAKSILEYIEEGPTAKTGSAEVLLRPGQDEPSKLRRHGSKHGPHVNGVQFQESSTAMRDRR